MRISIAIEYFIENHSFTTN